MHIKNILRIGVKCIFNKKKSDSKKSQNGESLESPHPMANACSKWRKIWIAKHHPLPSQNKIQKICRKSEFGGSSSGNTNLGVERVIVKVTAQCARCATSIKSPVNQSVSQPVSQLWQGQALQCIALQRSDLGPVETSSNQRRAMNILSPARGKQPYLI